MIQDSNTVHAISVLFPPSLSLLTLSPRGQTVGSCAGSLWSAPPSHTQRPPRVTQGVPSQPDWLSLLFQRPGTQPQLRDWRRFAQLILHQAPPPQTWSVESPSSPTGHCLPPVTQLMMRPTARHASNAFYP